MAKRFLVEEWQHGEWSPRLGTDDEAIARRMYTVIMRQRGALARVSDRETQHWKEEDR